MVLVLQLDDEARPVREERGNSHLPNPLRQVSTRNNGFGDGRDYVVSKASPPELLQLQQPPAYSEIDQTGTLSHHPAILRVDQPWILHGSTNPFHRIVSREAREMQARTHQHSEAPPYSAESAPGLALSRSQDEADTDLQSWKAQTSSANQSFARLLQAYPVVISTVSHLDLTDLSSLSLSCWAIHDGLLQFRSQVLAYSLRCINETIPRDPKTAAPPRWFPPCARDLVAPCRRCLQTVCRNCTAKPKNGLLPTRRYRRLCKTCQTSPLVMLGVRDQNFSHESADMDHWKNIWPPNGICMCARASVHICRSCESGQAGADQTYNRVWDWRTRYRNLGFGLGTGVGEGSAGVKCGRAASCLAASDAIVDIDCAEAFRSARSIARAYLLADNGDAVRSSDSQPPTPSTPLTAMVVEPGILDAAGAGLVLPGTPDASDRPTAPQERNGLSISTDSLIDAEQPDVKQESAGYYRHEVEGIGGVVKKKLKKRVRVAATVTEYEDESQTGTYLERERSHATRSWCAWCDRVVLSLADVQMLQDCEPQS